MTHTTITTLPHQNQPSNKGTSYPLKDLIALWADKYLELEQYFVQHSPVSGLDPKFLALLGDSVYRINVYNHALLEHLGYAWIHNNSDVTEQAKEIKRFGEFHNDLVVSKVKHFFFKELPNQTSNELFFPIDREVYEVGSRLWMQGPECSYAQLKHDLGYYFYLLGLAYAFVYDSYKDKGVFLHFAYDQSRFEALKGMILAGLDSIDESQGQIAEKGFRELSNRVLPEALSKYMHWHGLPRSTPGSLRQTYADFVYHFSQGNISALEPLSWHVLDLMSKIDGLIQDSLEPDSTIIRQEQQETLVHEITGFLRRLLQAFSGMYAKNRLDWQELYEIESWFLNQCIYDNLFRRPDLAEVSSNLECLEKDLQGLVVKEVRQRHSELDPSQGVLPVLQALPEKQMKVESLLEYLDRDSLLAVLQAYAGQSGFEPYDYTPPQIIGFYSSGIFLAHMLRLLHPKLALDDLSAGVQSSQSAYSESKVWMFKAYPYIAVHPLHDPRPMVAKGGVLICDESVKTGFTYSIFEAYSQRFHPPVDRFVVQSVFEHEWYIDVETLHQPRIYSLFQVQDASSKIRCSLNSLSVPDLELGLDTSQEKLLQSVRQCISKNGQVDYTHVIADTRAALAVACSFAQEILAGLGDATKEVFIFSPSPEGRVLGLLTAFVLRLRDIPVSFDVQKRHECFRVLVDLSLMTGFTASFQWELATDAAKPLNYSQLEQEFDRVLSLDKLLEKFS